MDFGPGKRLTSLPALRQIGYTASRRLLAVQKLSHDPITGADVLHPSSRKLRNGHRAADGATRGTSAAAAQGQPWLPGAWLPAARRA